MAEALGVAAGVIQFIDVGVRFVLKLNRFCSDVRDAPQILRSLHTDLRQQLDIAQSIRANHRFASQSVIPADLGEIPLRHHINLIENLDRLLDSLTAEENDGLWRRGWKGILTAKRKDDILELCGQLERQKSSLSMWLSEINFKLSAEMVSDLAQVHQCVQQTIPLLQTIDESSSRNAAVIEQMHPQINQLHQTTSEVSANIKHILPQVNRTHQMSTNILTETQELCSQVDKLDQTVLEVLADTKQMLPQLDEIREMSTTNLTGTKEILPQIGQISLNSSIARLNSERILPKLDQICADNKSLRDDLSQFYALMNWSTSLKNPISQDLDQIEQRVASSRESDTFREQHDEHYQNHDPNISTQSRELSSFTNCACKSRNQTVHWEPFPMLQFKRSLRSYHYSYCPKCKNSDQSLELMMRIILPSWLSTRSINWSLQIKNWNTDRGFSMSPMVIGTSRLVETAKSPAFQALFIVGKKLWDCRFKQSSILIPYLQGVLHDLYQNQSASPLDEDYVGKTLLSEVVFLYKKHQTCAMKPSTPGDEYILLIQFLLENGADPNVINIDKSPCFACKPGISSGTVLDIFVDRLTDVKRKSPVENIRNNIIYEKLTDNGIIESELFNFRRFPEQIELSGHEQLISVILQRSESGFDSVVKHANINHISSFNGLTALHFAIQWPRALEYLITNGADVNATDKYGRRPIHLAVALGCSKAVNLLLQADCSLKAPWKTRSLLQEALQLRHPEKNSIVDAVVRALIDRHERLLSLARAVLTAKEISRLGISGFNKREQAIAGVKRAMTLHNFKVPKALDLDCYSVFDAMDYSGHSRLNPQIAERLWEAGFNDVHFRDGLGMTLVLQCWLMADFDMLAWFIQKGADPFSQHAEATLCGLHLYAYRIARPTSYFKFHSEEVNSDAQQIARLQQESNPNHDNCICLCSSQGCTPVTVLIKSIYRIDYTISYRCWLRKTTPSPALLRQYSYDCTRALVFQAMELKHTCCSIGQCGNIWPVDSDNESKATIDFSSEKRRLEEYMALYDQFLGTYHGSNEMLPFDLDKFIPQWKAMMKLESRRCFCVPL